MMIHPCIARMPACFAFQPFHIILITESIKRNSRERVTMIRLRASSAAPTRDVRLTAVNLTRNVPRCSLPPACTEACPVQSAPSSAEKSPNLPSRPSVSLARAISGAASAGVALELVLGAMGLQQHVPLAHFALDLQSLLDSLTQALAAAQPAAGATSLDGLALLAAQTAAAVGLAMALWKVLPVPLRMRITAAPQDDAREGAGVHAEAATAAIATMLLRWAADRVQRKLVGRVEDTRRLYRQSRHAIMDLLVGRPTLATVLTGIEVANTAGDALSSMEGLVDAAHHIL